MKRYSLPPPETNPMLSTDRSDGPAELTLGAASGTGPAIALTGSIDVREATLTPCRNVLRSILDVISQVQSSVGFEFEHD